VLTLPAWQVRTWLDTVGSSTPSSAYREATISGSPVCRALFQRSNWAASTFSSSSCRREEGREVVGVVG
jgi:hypothetical protein